jgi:hypothetical protein
MKLETNSNSCKYKKFQLEHILIFHNYYSVKSLSLQAEPPVPDIISFGYIIF